MMSFAENYPRNQGARLLDWLVAEGFELQARDRSAATQVLDDQHAINVFVSASKPLRDLVDEVVDVRVGFGLARRDINETTQAWRGQAPNDFGWAGPTVMESGGVPFFGGSQLQFGRAGTADSLVAKVEKDVEVLRSWANLDKIEELIFLEGNTARNGFHRIVTDALSGRADRSAPDLARIRSLAAEHGPESKAGLMISRFENALAEFRAKFPDGVER